jgi:hypothetical protein
MHRGESYDCSVTHTALTFQRLPHAPRCQERTRFSQYREQSCSVLLEFDEGTAHFDGPTTSKYSCRCAGFRSSKRRKSASHSDAENRPNLGSVRSVTILARGVWGSEQ